MDLDTQPMRGPREQGNTTSDILDHFIDDNYGDVLRSSLLNPSSYMSLPSVKTSPPQPQPRTMAMDWYVPDGTNRRVVEIPERKIADFHSPGGGTGALILTLMRLLLYYDTTKYLVDIDTGEVFGWITNQWRRTGLYCSPQLFIVSELTALTTRCCAALKMDLEQEQQTSVIQLQRARGDNAVIITSSTVDACTRRLCAAIGCYDTLHVKKLHQGQNAGGINIYYRVRNSTRMGM